MKEVLGGDDSMSDRFELLTEDQDATDVYFFYLFMIAFAVERRDEYLERRRKHSSSSSKMSSSTYNLLIDQVAMAPPKLYLTFLVVDVTKTLLKTVLPDASRKSVSLLASALSDSLRFWPLSIYVL